MASTVNIAFEKFMSKYIRLDTGQTEKARSSRDNLLFNINGFSGDNDFFVLADSYHLKFGSFARRTKIRPLDDIDIMICISAEGLRTYTEFGSTFYINGSEKDCSNGLLTPNTNYLNSTKVINRFIKKLGCLNDYSKAEMHKNQEAATLQLKSYTWNFDIVPCFHMDIDKFLIPDGAGNWKKTDPRIDNLRTTDLNQKHKGNLLDIIRLMKYWNNRNITLTIGSYLLECMILDIYKCKPEKEHYYIDLEFRDLLKTLSGKILSDVYDPKGIQGNLNYFSFSERLKISRALDEAYKKANEASRLEIDDKDQKAAITKWKTVLGVNFPDYS